MRTKLLYLLIVLTFAPHSKTVVLPVCAPAPPWRSNVRGAATDESSAVATPSNVADAITARQWPGRGGWENNPVFGRHPSPAKQAGINAGIFAAQSAGFYLTEHSKHAWVRWTGRALSGLAIEQHARLAACNAGINPHAPAIQNCGAYPRF